MSSVSGLSGSGINFTGLASGIDSNKIIEGLTSISQGRIESLKTRKDQLSLKQANFSGLQAQLSNFQGTVGKLSRALGGPLDGRKVTSTDDTILTGVASTTALPGTYSLTVTQLAQAQQVASAAVDPSTNFKTGTLSFKVGTGATTTVTIDSSNNTLSGVAAAINDARGDVRASVVTDAGGSRLLVSSTKTGSANTIAVTNNLTTGTGADLNPLATTVQAATDAQVKLGSGAGAITLTSATNKVEGAIDGVTLNLNKVDTGKQVTLNVAPDTATAKKAITDLVDSYNQVIDFIDRRDDYDSASKAAGVFLGNRDVANLKNELAASLTGSVGGINDKANRLSALGITIAETGKLSVDATKLDKVLAGEQPGVSVDDVRRLFALSGTTNNNGVTFNLGGDKTKPSGSTPYQVRITQAGTRAAIVGSSALAGSVNITALNNTFNLKVNNLTSTAIVIDAGTYTPTTLAAAIQAQVSGQFSGQVAVDLDAGKLRFTSQLYGGGSSLKFEGGSAIADMGLTGTETNTGQNVAGEFIVGGSVEVAAGVGQTLTGATTNANTAGVQMKVSLTPAQVGTETTVNLSVTQGIAARLNQVINRYADPVNGKLKGIDKGFQDQSSDFDKTISRETNIIESRKESLIKQFAAMESAVSSLKSLGSQLAGAFGVIAVK